LNWTPLQPGDPGYRANIEDRREPDIAPTDQGALVRGMPQNPFEWEMYTQQLRAREAMKAGQQIQQPPLNEARPGPGDPAGIEARRAAIEARIAADQAALKELTSRAKK